MHREALNVLILTAIVLLLGLNSIWAQTTSSTINPDWTNDADWTGTAPDYSTNQSAILAHNSDISGIPLNINSGHTVTINAGTILTTDEAITVKENGTLIINGTIIGTGIGNEFKIEKGTLIINTSGVINWAGFSTTVDDPATVTVNGTWNVDGDFRNAVTITGTGLINVGGTLENSGEIFGCTDAGSGCCGGGPGCLLSGGGIPIIINRVITNVSCNSGSDGAIDITVSGGTPGYSYTWSHGPTSEDVSGLSAGDYTVTITDAVLNTQDSTFTITEPAVLNATVNFLGITCTGGTDGSITISAPSGGSGSFEYTINGGGLWQGSGSFTNLSAGTYDVRIRDALVNTCEVTLNGALELTVPTDAVDPVILCPGDLTADCDISEQAAYADYAAFTAAGGSATDNCGIDVNSFTLLSEVSDVLSCPETVTRTYQISDVNGNSSTCQQDIVIDDTIDPTFDTHPGNLTAVCDISEQPAYTDYAAFVDAGGAASDNCGINAASFTLESEIPDGQSFPETVTRTYTIADLCGNTGMFSQDIVITDNEAPVITCSSDIEQHVDPGSCIAFVVVPAPQSSDNCGVISVTNDFNGLADASGDYPLGTTIVTWTVTDLNDNTDNCIQYITIIDDEGPDITCPGAITEYLDDNCEFIIPDYTGSVSVYDNCDQDLLVTQSPSPGTLISQSGTIQEITLSARDGVGNESACVFDVTLLDNTPPKAISLQDITVTIEEGHFKPFVTIPLPDFTDNCGILSVVNDFNGGGDASGIYTYGSTTVEYTVTDINNNTARFDQQVVLSLENEPEYGLVIPEAFSPNEDGLNDRFEILGMEQYPQNDLRVFNVHGLEVYHMKNYDNSWDGTPSGNLDNGKKLPTGTYYYVLRLEQEKTVVKGFVYIRRE